VRHDFGLWVWANARLKLTYMASSPAYKFELGWMAFEFPLPVIPSAASTSAPMTRVMSPARRKVERVVARNCLVLITKKIVNRMMCG
jgi:hypothetical protein